MLAASLLGLSVSPARAAILLFGEAPRVAVETGPASIDHTDTRYAVVGTDLGIMWQDRNNQTLIAFGDTYGRNATDWRSGTLAPAPTPSSLTVCTWTAS